MKKHLIVCDSCGEEVGPDGGSLRFNYSDARRGSKTADLCSKCAGELPGEPQGCRGRKPKDPE